MIDLRTLPADLLNGYADILRIGEILDTCYGDVASVDGDQNLMSRALTDRSGHGRRDFPKERVCGENADGSDYKIGMATRHYDRILPRRHMVGPSFEHIGGGEAVGSDRRDFMPGKATFQLFHDALAKAAALSVDYDYVHITILASQSLP